MPAISPSRLDKQVEEVLSFLEDPPEFRRKVLELLHYYADRTRRTTGAEGVHEEIRVIGVRRPVLRALSNGLESRTVRQPALVQLAASILWETGFRETKLLAACILGGQSIPEIANWAESWALACEDGAVLQEIAKNSLTRWREANPAEFLEKSRIWVSSDRAQLRQFGLLALQAALEDPAFEDLPTVFRQLTGMMDTVRGATRQVLLDVLQVLSKRIPQETARFRLDELERDPSDNNRIIRDSLAYLPIRQRDLLDRALSAQKPTGIMRPS